MAAPAASPRLRWTRCFGTFEGKVCVVTGAASGIGAAIARALDAEGATVVLVDCDPEAAAVARTLRRAEVHVLDVADAGAWERLAADLRASQRGAHLLVNNAGISVAGRFEEVPADVFDRLMAVNFGGAVNGCRALLPLLREAPSAHVVNVCSSFAWLGFAGKSAYGASKAALRAFSESLRAELSGTDVGVTLLFPGPVDTQLVRRGHAVDPTQREREAAFLARRAISAERVAARCLAGVRRNSARVVVGVDYRAIDLLVRFSPTVAAATMTALSKRMPF